MRPKLQDRVSSLNLQTTIHRAVTDVENPMIFSRPATEGRFLSQNVWVISIAGTSWMDEQRALSRATLVRPAEAHGHMPESGIYNDLTSWKMRVKSFTFDYWSMERKLRNSPLIPVLELLCLSWPPSPKHLRPARKWPW